MRIPARNQPSHAPRIRTDQFQEMDILGPFISQTPLMRIQKTLHLRLCTGLLPLVKQPDHIHIIVLLLHKGHKTLIQRTHIDTVTVFSKQIV